MNAKILVVDDSTDLLEIFSFILTKHGFEVATIDNAGNIEEVLNTFLPDLMLLDVKLNGTDGRKLCKELKGKFNKDVPVILVSASPELLKDHKECLVVDVIEKPFDLKTVTEKISIALSKSINTPLN